MPSGVLDSRRKVGIATGGHLGFDHPVDRIAENNLALAHGRFLPQAAGTNKGKRSSGFFLRPCRNQESVDTSLNQIERDEGRIREVSVKSRTSDSNESFLRSFRDFSLGSSACGIEFFDADAGFREAELKIENLRFGIYDGTVAITSLEAGRFLIFNFQFSIMP